MPFRLSWLYISAVLQRGCGEQALGEDVKAGRVVKLPAVLSVAAQEEVEVFVVKGQCCEVTRLLGKEGGKKDFNQQVFEYAYDMGIL